jgi:hypothetical protein
MREVTMDSLGALFFSLWVAAQLLAVIFFKTLAGDKQTIRHGEDTAARRADDDRLAQPVDYKATAAADR